MSWPLVFAILGTAALLGRALDTGLHRIYSPALKLALFRRAIRFDELSYVELLHADAQKSARIIDRVFGRRTFSVRMLVLSVFPVVFVIAGAAVARVTDHPLEVLLPTTVGWESFASVVLMLGVNIVTDQVSLNVTRGILHRVRPALGSLAPWLMLDVLVMLMLGGMPILAAMSPEEILRNPATLLILPVVAPLAAVGVVALPLLFEPTAMDFLLSLILLLVVLTGALPTLIHMAIALRDLAAKAVYRPVCIYLSGLLETLSAHERPMTTILTALGTIPVLIKLWLEVLG